MEKKRNLNKSNADTPRPEINMNESGFKIVYVIGDEKGYWTHDTSPLSMAFGYGRTSNPALALHFADYKTAEDVCLMNGKTGKNIIYQCVMTVKNNMAVID